MSDYTPRPKHEADATIMTGAGNLMRNYAILYLQEATRLAEGASKEKEEGLPALQERTVSLIKAATVCERAALAVEDAVREILAIEIVS